MADTYEYVGPIILAKVDPAYAFRTLELYLRL